jgi:predicted metal-dependent hydrolase
MIYVSKEVLEFIDDMNIWIKTSVLRYIRDESTHSDAHVLVILLLEVTVIEILNTSS